MENTRREFMRNVGVVLASLFVSGCQPTCYEPMPLTPPASTGQEWDRLREQWLGLDQLARDAKDDKKGQQTLERLLADHRAALEQLAETGELDAAVAQDIQAAFEGAANHVWRANAPITCYEPSIYPQYRIQSADDLARQAQALAEMAQSGALDEGAVAQAQAAIERDVAFLAMSTDQEQALLDAVIKAAGDTHNFPALAELELDISPESIEAARILVNLLLRKSQVSTVFPGTMCYALAP